MVDGTVQFVDVEMPVLKVYVVHEPCNELLPLTVRVVEGWVEINRRVTAVKSPVMVKHIEGEISEAPISELYSSRTLKQWESSWEIVCRQVACKAGVKTSNTGEKHTL